ncbi:MAG: Vitamin B12 import ATP-binding protein BtuD [Fimbriimonadaceae bacterium]|nr:Vitamin B12 import ATP-binding protein BtuD [Fimbriimonadaceae bacterium]
MSAAIHCENLRVRYRKNASTWTEAVSGLSFQIAPGESVGFLGPNGAGKSSTLKALMGFLAPADGQASIFGRPAGSIEARQLTGYLPEVGLYYPYLTPRETLRLYGELQGLGGRALKREVGDLLELVGLAKSADRLNRTLSKGMLQRVGIAQALLGDPQLLILDEVTSGLDPLGRKELRNWLRERQGQGTTLFFSSHELAEVEMLCDRFLLIHQGRLIDEREMGELMGAIGSYHIRFKGSVGLHDLAESISGTGGEFSARFASKSAMLQAIDRVHRDGGKILDVTTHEGELEDYFVSRIQEAA